MNIARDDRAPTDPPHLRADTVAPLIDGKLMIAFVRAMENGVELLEQMRLADSDLDRRRISRPDA